MPQQCYVLVSNYLIKIIQNIANPTETNKLNHSHNSPLSTYLLYGNKCMKQLLGQRYSQYEMNSFVICMDIQEMKEEFKRQGMGEHQMVDIIVTHKNPLNNNHNSKNIVSVTNKPYNQPTIISDLLNQHHQNLTKYIQTAQSSPFYSQLLRIYPISHLQLFYQAQIVFGFQKEAGKNKSLYNNNNGHLAIPLNYFIIESNPNHYCTIGLAYNANSQLVGFTFPINCSKYHLLVKWQWIVGWKGTSKTQRKGQLEGIYKMTQNYNKVGSTNNPNSQTRTPHCQQFDLPINHPFRSVYHIFHSKSNSYCTGYSINGFKAEKSQRNMVSQTISKGSTHSRGKINPSSTQTSEITIITVAHLFKSSQQPLSQAQRELQIRQWPYGKQCIVRRGRLVAIYPSQDIAIVVMDRQIQNHQGYYSESPVQPESPQYRKSLIIPLPILHSPLPSTSILTIGFGIINYRQHILNNYEVILPMMVVGNITKWIGNHSNMKNTNPIFLKTNLPISHGHSGAPLFIRNHGFKLQSDNSQGTVTIYGEGSLINNTKHNNTTQIDCNIISNPMAMAIFTIMNSFSRQEQFNHFRQDKLQRQLTHHSFYLTINTIMSVISLSKAIITNQNSVSHTKNRQNHINKLNPNNSNQTDDNKSTLNADKIQKFIKGQWEMQLNGIGIWGHSQSNHNECNHNQYGRGKPKL